MSVTSTFKPITSQDAATLFRAVQSGKVKAEDLNERGKAALLKYGLDIGKVSRATLSQTHLDLLKRNNVQGFEEKPSLWEKVTTWTKAQVEKPLAGRPAPTGQEPEWTKQMAQAGAQTPFYALAIKGAEATGLIPKVQPVTTKAPVTTGEKIAAGAGRLMGNVVSYGVAKGLTAPVVGAWAPGLAAKAGALAPVVPSALQTGATYGTMAAMGGVAAGKPAGQIAKETLTAGGIGALGGAVAGVAGGVVKGALGRIGAPPVVGRIVGAGAQTGALLGTYETAESLIKGDPLEVVFRKGLQGATVGFLLGGASQMGAEAARVITDAVQGGRNVGFYREVLGVGPDATKLQINKAFRELAKQYHPDVNPLDPTLPERFKAISEAKQVLDNVPKLSSWLSRILPPAERVSPIGPRIMGVPGLPAVAGQEGLVGAPAQTVRQVVSGAQAITPRATEAAAARTEAGVTPTPSKAEIVAQGAPTTEIEAQRRIDAYEDTLAAKYGEEAIIKVPTYHEETGEPSPIPAAELNQLRRLYAERDKVWAEEEARDLAAIPIPAGPVPVAMMREGLRQVQKDFRYGVGIRKVSQTDIEGATNTLFGYVTERLTQQHKFPEALVGDLTESVRAARDWPNTIYGMNPGPVVEQVTAAVKAALGVPGKRTEAGIALKAPTPPAAGRFPGAGKVAAAFEIGQKVYDRSGNVYTVVNLPSVNFPYIWHVKNAKGRDEYIGNATGQLSATRPQGKPKTLAELLEGQAAQPVSAPVAVVEPTVVSTPEEQRRLYIDAARKGLSSADVKMLIKDRYGATSSKDLTHEQLSALSDEILFPVEVKPIARSSTGPPLKFAEVLTTPALFRAIGDVSLGKRSLLRNELVLLPPGLRDQVTTLDTEAGIVNQRARWVLAMNKTQVPGELTGAALATYDGLMSELESVSKRRDALHPEIVKVLDAKGKVAATVLERIESGETADVVPIKLSEAVEGLRKVEGAPEGVVGYMWKSPLKGTTLFIPPVPEPDNAFEAMLGKPVNLYAAVLEPVRDLFGEQVVRPWRNASRQYQVFVNEYQGLLHKTLQPFAHNPQARERVQLMLEGKMPPGGAEGRAAAVLRNRFYGASPDGALFREFGIDPQRYLAEYAPRVREAGGAEKAFPQGVPDELRFFAEQERTGNLMPRETDALQTALAYLRAGAKKKFFNPVIDQLEPYMARMHPDRRFIYEQLIDGVLGRPIMEERMCDELIKAVANPILRSFGKEVTGRPAQAASAFMMDFGYLGTVGFNLFSALKNLTQQLLVVSHLSEKYPGEGLKWWAKAKIARLTPTGRELLKYNWVSQHRIYLEGIDLQFRATEKFMGPLRKSAFFLFQQADMDNANTAYLAGTLRALNEGKPLDQAVELGNMTAASTQYLYGIDSPMLFKGPLGRQLGMLGSWPLNFMRLLWEEGTSDTKSRVLQTLIVMALGSYLLSKVTGLSFRSIHPWETIKTWLPSSWMSGQRSITVEVVYNTIDYLRKRLEGNDPTLVDEALDALKDSLSTFIPGKIQLNRVIKFIEAAKNEWRVYDERGRLRYEMTPGEAIRGLVGSTVEAQKRYEESQAVSKKLRAYSDLRKRALDAWFRDDVQTYDALQDELAALGKPILPTDLIREIELRQETSLERQKRGLPSPLR